MAEQLIPDQVAEILSQPNGPYVLLELTRMGWIDAETAVTTIEEARPEPFLRRLAFALLNTFFSGGGHLADW